MAGIAIAAAGLLVVALAELAQPVGGPGLFDGVVFEEPYRYVAPGPGQLGGPSSAEATLNASGGTSPAIVIATTETPPQAQLIAAEGAISLPFDSGAVDATITPVAPSAAQAAGVTLVGNVYRYAVTDGAGNALSIATGARVSTVLRIPGDTSGTVIALWDGQAWQTLETGHGGSPDILSAPSSRIGDFVILAQATLLGDGVKLALIALSLLVIGVGWLALRRPRRAQQPLTRPSPKRRSTSKNARRRRGGGSS